MIKIIAGGKKHFAWVAEACAEYEKRLRKPFEIEWQFVDEAKLEEKVLRLDSSAFVVLLDERGQLLSSQQFSSELSSALVDGREVVLVLGGAFGHFSEALKGRANLLLSLSKMVYPHQICRVVLAEQIYRAQEIYLGHPYHHA